MDNIKLTNKHQKGIIVHCPQCGKIFDIPMNTIASELGSLGGLKRKENLSPAERSRQASQASRARWDKVSKDPFKQLAGVMTDQLKVKEEK